MTPSAIEEWPVIVGARGRVVAEAVVGACSARSIKAMARTDWLGMASAMGSDGNASPEHPRRGCGV